MNGALNLLSQSWEGTFKIIPFPTQKGHLFFPLPETACADAELLPKFHDVSVFPKKELPFFILFTAGLCSCTALLALLTHYSPENMMTLAQTLLHALTVPFKFLKELLP